MNLLSKDFTCNLKMHRCASNEAKPNFLLCIDLLASCAKRLKRVLNCSCVQRRNIAHKQHLPETVAAATARCQTCRHWYRYRLPSRAGVTVSEASQLKIFLIGMQENYVKTKTYFFNKLRSFFGLHLFL